MVRQKPRKSVEELYAPKFETTPIKSQVQHVGNPASKGMRSDRDFGGYIISSNTPYASNCAAPTGGGAPNSVGMATNRRKPSRPPPMKVEKIFPKEEKLLNLDEVKIDHNSKAKTTRPEKCRYNSPNMYDNKNYVSYSENSQKDVRQSLHHHHHHTNHDDDKDDDTEEFFELIKHTVENAIGKSVSDLLNRNFRELSAKVDRFSAELKATNTLLNKLQTEISNKVVHYGEENSRHFRYLCMKSEYDKMFYQHHSMISNPATPTPERRAPPVPPKINTHSEEKVPTGCSCRGSSKTPPSSEPQKSSSAEEQSMSNKSSEMGMREVLDHIQRFCAQMQLNELKSDERVPKNFRLEDAVKINKQVFEEDDDDFQMSSDGMTPRSDDHVHKYGGNTLRSCSKTRGNGGGDA